MRLGDILIAAGRVKVADVERALMRQRTTGDRLGASLVENGVVDLDEIARALARQHNVPAALGRHLAGRDPALAARLPGPTAREAWALPVALSRGAEGVALVVCFRDPSPEIIARITAVAGCQIIPAVACELVLRREIERAYPMPVVAAEADDEAIDVFFDEPSQPLFAVDELTLVGLDDRRVTRDESQSLMMPHLRQSGQVPVMTSMAQTTGPVPTMAHAARPAFTAPAAAAPVAPPPAAEPAAPPPIAAVAPVPVAAPAVAGSAGLPTNPARPPPLLLDEALARIATAPTRDAVCELALDYLRGVWHAAVVLIVKEGMALGHRGFGGSVTATSIESIVVPLNQPSFLRTAHDDRRAFVGEAPIGSIAQDRFMRLFAVVGSKILVAAPVIVRDRPVCVLFGLGPIKGLAEAAPGAIVLARAMGEAYLRQILDGKKQA